MKTLNTLEVEGSDKLALIAEALALLNSSRWQAGAACHAYGHFGSQRWF
jgi:hypothetical protein